MIYESQFSRFIKRGKLCITLVNFMTKFKLRVQEVTKFFTYFYLQLFRMKSGKKPCPRFLITFLLYEILAYIFVFFEIATKTFEESRDGFALRLFYQMYTTFKRTTPDIFLVRARTLYAYRESSQKTYTFSLLL